jgi:hypothetical protein
VLLHRLGQQTPDQLWVLHLWAAYNFAYSADPEGAVGALAAPIGGVPTALIANQPVDTVAADPGVQGRIVKLVDGVALRGPMDIYARQTGGVAAPVDATQRVTFFGHMVRGEESKKAERRFFDPGSLIGDQATDFSGGKAIITIPIEAGGVPVVVHNTDADYIDEITLDMYESIFDGGGFLALAFAGDPAVPVIGGIGAPPGPRTLRIFDGFPVRNVGPMVASNLRGNEGTGVISCNGYFVRG